MKLLHLSNFSFTCHICKEEFVKMKHLMAHCKEVHQCLAQVCGRTQLFEIIKQKTLIVGQLHLRQGSGNLESTVGP